MSLWLLWRQRDVADNRQYIIQYNTIYPNYYTLFYTIIYTLYYCYYSLLLSSVSHVQLPTCKCRFKILADISPDSAVVDDSSRDNHFIIIKLSISMKIHVHFHSLLSTWNTNYKLNIKRSLLCCYCSCFPPLPPAR